MNLMFKNSYNDSEIEARHTCSVRPFKEVPLANLFNQNYEDEEFYSGEEADLTDKEHSKSARTEEVQTKELHRGEPKNLGTTPTIKVSNITPPVVLEALSNQCN
jgi:hypothetical protein